jgi:hypothetical protein
MQKSSSEDFEKLIASCVEDGLLTQSFGMPRMTKQGAAFVKRVAAFEKWLRQSMRRRACRGSGGEALWSTWC